jgi:hypothetical protein
VNLQYLYPRKQELEKEEIFPKPGEKVSADAKRFLDRIKVTRVLNQGFNLELL